jgi:twinkle protein
VEERPSWYAPSQAVERVVEHGEDMNIEELDALFEDDPAPVPEALPPAAAPGDVRLLPDHVAFLQKRGISLETANLGKLFSVRKFMRTGGDQDCIAFPYYDMEGTLASSKYRSVATKAFSQDAGAGGLLYGLHQTFDTSRPLVICEGEIDALSVAQVGIPNWVSVPAGAPAKGEKGNSQRFSWIADLEDFLARFKQFVLCVDSDAPGKNLCEELARRLGRSKCQTVVYPKGCKDANDTLLQGEDLLRTALAEAKPIPLTSLYTADHYFDQVMELFTKGDGRGESTGFAGVDNLYTVARGQMTVVTGVPSSGKSNFLDQIMVNLAHQDNWKFAIASMENEPSKHIAKLSEMHLKKPFFSQWPGSMTKQEAQEAINWCKTHFTFIDFSTSRDLPTVDSLLDRAHAAVMRYGIDGLVIDPYNCLDLGRGDKQSETDAVSGMLSKISAFAKASNIHVWFVAHPQKMQAFGGAPIPGGYDISGSAHWFNKTDCGLTVHRKDADGYVEIHCWKCRFKWVGKQGMTRLKYDIPTSTYYELP